MPLSGWIRQRRRMTLTFRNRASLPTYIPEGYLQISDSAVKNFGIYTDYFNESDNRIMTLAQQPLERLSLHIDTEDLDHMRN